MHRTYVGEPTDRTNSLDTERVRGRQIDGHIAKAQTHDLYLVQDYDPTKGTVDVVCKTDPDSQAYFNVPVVQQDPGMGLAIYQSFRTIASGSASPTVGWLAFPHNDSSYALENHGRVRGIGKVTHQGKDPVFIPGIPMRQDAAPSGLGTAWNKGDTVLVHRSGSMIIFTDAGDVIISAIGKVRALGAGGYSGGTGVSLGGGAGDPASSNVFAN